jgi:uncharacterized iron-regulated membrane protein
MAHTWLGLSAGLLFCVLSISGSIIVFRPQIEKAMGPKPTRPATCVASSRDADEALRIIEAYEPGSRVDRIGFMEYAPDVWRFQLTRDEGRSVAYIAYDACTRQVLGAANVAWVDWLVDLHHNLLIGKTGRHLTGIIGMALLLMSISGLIIWLVSNPRWQTALRINTGASFHRFAFDSHRSFGLAAMVVLVAQSLTGIWLAWPETMRAALNSIVTVDAELKPAKKKEKARKPGDPPHLSALILAVSKAMPDGRLAELRLPGSPGKPVQARVLRPGDPRSTGNNTITLNASTAAIISIDRFADRPPAGKAVEWITPIHYGEWGSLGARILLAAAGLMLPVLLISGVLIWWLPKRVRARKAAKLPSAEPRMLTF